MIPFSSSLVLSELYNNSLKGKHAPPLHDCHVDPLPLHTCHVPIEPEKTILMCAPRVAKRAVKLMSLMTKYYFKRFR